MLERFAPAFVVVDDAGEIVHYSGRTGKYLEAPTGAPTRQLIPQARKDLRLELSSALAEARDTAAPVHRPNLHVQMEDRRQYFDLAVESLVAPDQSRVFVVVFEDAGSPLSQAQESSLRQPATTADEVQGEIAHTLRGRCKLEFVSDGLRAQLAFPAAGNLAERDRVRPGDRSDERKDRTKARRSCSSPCTPRRCVEP